MMLFNTLYDGKILLSHDATQLNDSATSDGS